MRLASWVGVDSLMLSTEQRVRVLPQSGRVRLFRVTESLPEAILQVREPCLKV